MCIVKLLVASVLIHNKSGIQGPCQSAKQCTWQNLPPALYDISHPCSVTPLSCPTDAPLLHGLTPCSQIHIDNFCYVQEVEVNDEDIIQQLMEHSNANRSTGSTGANSESSRSHSIMQVIVQICQCMPYQ